MKQDEFNKLFPNADSAKFFEDDYGVLVFVDAKGYFNDVEFPAFWNGSSSVGYLHLDPSAWKFYLDDLLYIRDNFLFGVFQFHWQRYQ